MQNGLIDRTKCQSSERKGNLFRLLCIAHRTTSRHVLQQVLQLNVCQWTNFVQFIKLYLALEEWFHDVSDKDKVWIARGKISQILGSLQKNLSKI